MCVGEKVYILGMKYPRLRIYNTATREWEERSYPTKGVDYWYGTPTSDGNYLMVYNYGDRAVVRWDTRTDKGTVIPYTLDGPPPGSGRLTEDGAAMYSVTFRMPYRLIKLARLDLQRDEWTDEWAIPQSDEDIRPLKANDPAGEVIWRPHTLKGYLLGFHTGLRRWTDRIRIPGYGDMFHFVGGGVEHDGLIYYSLSTYRGVDGEHYHFLNACLVFDPETRQFDIMRMPTPGDDYHQVAYTLSAGGRLFCTAHNIRQPDGSLRNGPDGDIIFWQSRLPAAGGQKTR